MNLKNKWHIPGPGSTYKQVPTCKYFELLFCWNVDSWKKKATICFKLFALSKNKKRGVPVFKIAAKVRRWVHKKAPAVNFLKVMKQFNCKMQTSEF